MALSTLTCYKPPWSGCIRCAGEEEVFVQEVEHAPNVPWLGALGCGGTAKRNEDGLKLG